MSNDDEELRKSVVAWATNYTEMDCNRVRDAKPLMDNLLGRITTLSRQVAELEREKAEAEERAKTAYEEADHWHEQWEEMCAERNYALELATTGDQP